MSYIPKSAQRKIDKSNAALKLLPHRVAAAAGAPFVPLILYAGAPGAGMWDVFLDGVKQHLCSYVDVNAGYIRRFTKGAGNKPSTNETEKVFGLVEIKRKVR